MKMKTQAFIMLLISLFLTLVACTGKEGEPVAQVPTATLVPLVTLSPLPTATPVVTRTPLPTFTPIPSDTLTPSVTPIPPTLTPTATIGGIVGGGQRINFRAGPSETADVIGSLTPGDGVVVLGVSADDRWLNIRVEDGTEGWVAKRLIYLPPTLTPRPSATPTTDLTAIALGTVFPTALLGGGSITPTPVRIGESPTPINGTPDGATGTPTLPFLPIINVDTINQTATALAGGIVAISPPPPATNVPGVPTSTRATNPTAVSADPTTTPPPVGSDVSVQSNRLVFALCDDLTRGGDPAPTDLAAGSSIIIWWSWIVSDPGYIVQHEAHVSYEITLNGVSIPGWRQYGGDVQQTGNSYVKSWYLPAGTLNEPGIYKIEYRATWDERIYDGYDYFGPGSRNPADEGSCTFTVGG